MSVHEREHPMNIFDFDLAGIFSFTASPLELILRGTLLLGKWSAINARTAQSG